MRFEKRSLEPGGLYVSAYRRKSGCRQRDRPSERKFPFLDQREETGRPQEDGLGFRQCDKMPPLGDDGPLAHLSFLDPSLLNPISAECRTRSLAVQW